MPDREKVISLVEDAIEIVEKEAFWTIANGLRDAITILKEQEAVEPKKGWFLNNLNIPEEHWFCGKCDEEIVGKGKYCTNCGQAVKWE